ncbi:MAG: hypothetical protein LBR14_00255 [Clostridiales Family XIII bacterium]|nr:hypothetical protein [Clostridiales Family XIII bacterium]
MEATRTEGPEDASFRLGMHESYVGEGDSPYADGGLLYEPLIITGDTIGERQIYSVRDLETLASLYLSTDELYATGLGIHEMCALPAGAGTAELAGLDLAVFLGLCGAADADEDARVYWFTDSGTQPAGEVLLTDLVSAEEGHRAMLAFGVFDAVPLVRSADAAGYDASAGNAGGPLLLCLPAGDEVYAVADVTKLIVGTRSEDPRYDFHADGGGDAQEPVLTIRVFAAGAAEDSTPISVLTYTAANLEQLAATFPEHVSGGYFGTIGDKASTEGMVIGGWIDYYEGLDFGWFLQEQVGLDALSGRALLYGRSGEAYVPEDAGELYGEIPDLSYFAEAPARPEACYVLTRDAVAITGSRPVLAFSKNGYPLLPAHEHESEDYVSYNQLNAALEALGVASEVGVVKNNKGPFIAGLGNLDGLYGGYRQETGGECIRMDIFLSI